jgi:hypothetical protein
MSSVLMIWDWLKSNHGLVAEAILSVVVALSLIAKLTPSEKDDALVAKLDSLVRKLLGLLGLQPKSK